MTAPLFESAKIDVLGGQTLRIRAQGAAPDAAYIQSLKLDGKPVSSTWVTLEQLKKGELDFVVSAAPNENWGGAPADAPPSLGVE